LGGLFLGLAFWFSYSNFILIPVFFLFLLLRKAPVKAWFWSGLSLMAVLAVHFLVRQYSDAGFHLDEFGLMSIRGENFSISEINVRDRLTRLPGVVANSALALPDSNLHMQVLRWVYYLLCLLSGVGWFMAYRNHRFDRKVYLVFPMILLFLVIYLFSPFFYAEDTGDYVMFRHLTYIMPLVSLMVVAGLASLRYQVFVVIFLLLGVYRSGQLFTLAKPSSHDMATKAAGWVLGTKLGHDTEALTSIVRDNPAKEALLIQGIGWGMGASLMHDIEVADTAETTSKIDELTELYFRYPESDRGDLLEGIRFSFSDRVTPRLNPEVLVKIEEGIGKSSGPDAGGR
jgi:hypothetical protein